MFKALVLAAIMVGVSSTSSFAQRCHGGGGVKGSEVGKTTPKKKTASTKGAEPGKAAPQKKALGRSGTKGM